MFCDMEGEAEASDHNKPSVLWEKHIQQSIFIDLSEDESLHLSDLENSLAFHLSQAESAATDDSIHFNGRSWMNVALFGAFFLSCTLYYLNKWVSIKLNR